MKMFSNKYLFNSLQRNVNNIFTNIMETYVPLWKPHVTDLFSDRIGFSYKRNAAVDPLTLSLYFNLYLFIDLM